MQRWGGAKSFPSMSAFRGDQPNKKPRLEEASARKNMQTKATEMDDDEWGDDWDETVIEDCMVIESTQICNNETSDNGNNGTNGNGEPSSAVNESGGFSIKNKVSNNNNITNNKNQNGQIAPNSFNISGFSTDSGFNENKSNNFRTNIKGNNLQGSNAYKNKFSDFASASQTSNQKFPRPTPTKRSTPTKNLSSNKASGYNSIPIKGLTEPNGDTQMKLESIRIEKKKLEDEVLAKQGQVALLKAELVRKEKALETERLDRCAALEASDLKVMEKVASAVGESDRKMKNIQKKVDKLESELHFKDREIQELTQQVKSLKKKQSSNSSHPPNSPPKRTPRTEPSVSPGSATSFGSKFDFGGLRVSTRTKETQTDVEISKAKKRIRLKLSSLKGQHSGSSDFSYMMSGSISRSQSAKARSQTKNNETDAINLTSVCSNGNIPNIESSMPAEWTDLLAQMVNIPISESNSEQTKSLKSRLFSLATDRVKEVQLTLLTNEPKNIAEDDSTTTNTFTLSPEQWYLSQMTPALSILRTTSDKTNAQCALRYLVNHLTPLVFKEVTVNERIIPTLLETVQKVIRNSQVILDNEFCELIVSSILNYLGSSKNFHENITVIVELLYSFADQVLFNNLLCSMKDGCLISQLCMAIQKEKLPDKSLAIGNNLSWQMVAWLSELLKEPPVWLINGNCICSQELLNTLLELVLKSNVVFNSLNPGISPPYGSKLLLKCLQVIHSWAVADLYFHDKYISLPLLFNLIKTIKQPNKLTVDIMADLYSSDTLREYLESEGLIDSDSADEEMEAEDSRVSHRKQTRR